MLVGTFIVGVLVRESARIQATERDRLKVLSNVLASAIEENLAATNRAPAGVIKDYRGPSGPVSSSFDVSCRLAALSDTTLYLSAPPIIQSRTIWW